MAPSTLKVNGAELMFREYHWACVVCGSGLTHHSRGLNCEHCVRAFPIVDGVVVFSPDPQEGNFESGLADESGIGLNWTEFLDRPGKSSKFEEFFDERGVMPIWMVGGASARSILYLGCTTGAVPRVMARYFESVTVADPCCERLLLLSSRAMSESCTNLSFVCCKGVPRLPFAEKSFDFVVVDTTAFPHECVAFPAFWKGIHSVLEDGGRLCVVAQNGSRLSRRLSSESGHIPGGPFGVPRLVRLLRRLGVDVVDVFGLQPNSRAPVVLFDVRKHDRPRRLDWLQLDARNDFQRRVKEACCRRPSITPAFGISAVKRSLVSVDVRGYSSIVDEVLSSISDKLGTPLDDIRLRRLEARRSGRLVAIAEQTTRDDCDPIAIKMPYRTSAVVSDRRNAQALSLIHGNRSISTELKAVIPKPLTCGKAGKQEFFVETALGVGNATHSFEGASPHIVEAFGGALLRLHCDTARVVVLTDAELQSTHQALNSLQTRVGTIETRSVFAKLNDLLRQTLVGQRLPLVWTHGDAGTGNVVCGRDGELQGVFDWEAFDQSGLPMHDWITLCVSQKLRQDKREAWLSLRYALTGQFTLFFEPLNFDDYRTALDIPTAVMPGLVIATWANYASHRLRNRGRDSVWVQRTLLDVVDLFDSIL